MRKLSNCRGSIAFIGVLYVRNLNTALGAQQPSQVNCLENLDAVFLIAWFLEKFDPLQF
jgi:hypothetical protein